MRALDDPARRRVVGGRAYFITDGFAVHTTEFFAPLLQGLGFSVPVPVSLLPLESVDAKAPGAAAGWVRTTAGSAAADGVRTHESGSDWQN